MKSVKSLLAVAVVSIAAVSCGNQEHNASALQAASNDGKLLSIVVRGDLMPGPGPYKRPVFAQATIQAVSSGCTNEASFKVEAFQKSVSSQDIKVTRVKIDGCRALPRTIQLQVPIANFAPFKDVTYLGKPFKNVKKEVTY